MSKEDPAFVPVLEEPTKDYLMSLVNKIGFIFDPEDYVKEFRFWMGEVFHFKVKEGSEYFIWRSKKCAYTSTSLKRKTYPVFMFKKLSPKNKAHKERPWEIVKFTKRNLLWKTGELARAWKASKLEEVYEKKKSSGKVFSIERISQISDMGQDSMGRIHKKPVFSKIFNCQSCGHEWQEFTFEHGVKECERCKFSFSF